MITHRLRFYYFPIDVLLLCPFLAFLAAAASVR